MNCKKDEAAKAKELAEKKLEEKDLRGAKKFAMKAHSLFSRLDGLQSLLATLNIFIAAERKINGEVDWYGVLGVDPSSDDETVKKQYRKLALTLHPDKNKTVGAEGAFKILSEAWSLLSDKTRKIAYDQKRSSRTIFEKVMPKHPSQPVSGASLHPSANNSNFNVSKNAPNPHLAPRRNTFWTVCTSCKMQFEYVLFYLNKKLECYSCKEPFLAIPISPPQTNLHPPWAAQVSNSAGVPAGYSGDVGSVPMYSSATQAMNGTQLSCENSKRMHENAHMSATLEHVIKSKTNSKRANAVAGDANGTCPVTKSEKPRKRRRANVQRVSESGAGNFNVLFRGNKEFGVGSASGVQRSTDETEGSSVGSKWLASTRELSLLETRNMLMEKAKKEICKKLNDWKDMAGKPKASNKEGGLRENEKKVKVFDSEFLPNAVTNGVENVSSKLVSIVGAKHQYEKVNTSVPTHSAVDSETQASESALLSMTVSDPDFHDFDKDRTENSFGDNQVWAAYDNDDGMPRYYAIIHNVISRKPFKMRISWLNSKSNAEFGPINWVGRGFYKTSGDFRVGKHELNRTVNSFSHRVKWTKGARGAISIYPSKGDVWAVYRNWSPEWDEHTPDQVIHQYDMVEILTDYNEENGVTVIPLVKVAGFKTVFRRHMDQEQVRIIPRQEIFRLSHQVPSCLLTDQISPSTPKGCLDLDPAATPMELLQVIPEAREQVMMQNAEETARDDVSDAKMTQVKEAIRSDTARSEAGIMGAGIRVHVGTATVG